MFNENEVVTISSYGQMSSVLVPREPNAQQDGLVTSVLKSTGIIPRDANFRGLPVLSDLEQKRDQYQKNHHKIPNGQDGFITTFFKQVGVCDWRDKYEGWGVYSHSEIQALIASQTIENDGREVTTILQYNSEGGEIEARQGLQIIDETKMNKFNKDENKDVSFVEVLDDDVNNSLKII